MGQNRVPTVCSEHPPAHDAVFYGSPIERSAVLVSQSAHKDPPFRQPHVGRYIFVTSKSLFFRPFRAFKSEGKTSSSVGPLSPTQEGLNHMIGSSTCRPTSRSTNLHLQPSSSSKEAFRGMCGASGVSCPPERRAASGEAVG